MAKLILIAGVSRSGKSTLANKLSVGLPNAIVLHQDEFVLPESDLPMINERIDWEKPETINWEVLIDKIDSYKAQDYIILEGIFALSNTALLEKADHKILLDLSYHEFIARRKTEKRWGKEPAWFLEHVWHSHLKYHNPHKTTLDYKFVDLSPSSYSELLDQLKS